jgi:hypothetical protein
MSFPSKLVKLATGRGEDTQMGCSVDAKPARSLRAAENI